MRFIDINSLREYNFRLFQRARIIITLHKKKKYKTFINTGIAIFIFTKRDIDNFTDIDFYSYIY